MTAVAVVGAGRATAAQEVAAQEVGRLLAARGVQVVTGGLGGVMQAASRGAAEAGGVTVGLLPGDRRSDGNAWLTVTVPTGMGEMRNGLVVRAADAVVAVGGELGTLSEVALALKAGKRVIAVGFGFGLPGVEVAQDAAGAVALLLD